MYIQLILKILFNFNDIFRNKWVNRVLLSFQQPIIVIDYLIIYGMSSKTLTF